MFAWFRDRRRELLGQPFPAEWERVLQQNVAHYPLLSPTQQERLRRDARVIIAEKHWEGCGGLKIKDEMKVTVAGQAALLLLGLKHDYFTQVLSILIYPSTFVIPVDEEEVKLDWHNAFAGQAVYRGPVILAWDQVRVEAQEPEKGHNVVIHEFAHQLDFLDGYTNGTPDLASDEHAQRWHDVMTAEFTKLRSELDTGQQSFLGDYAASNESEFFAVATERFFTRPGRLKNCHPELYAVLSEYYDVDPYRWFAAGPWMRIRQEADV
jgi:hypothetical protein